MGAGGTSNKIGVCIKEKKNGSPDSFMEGEKNRWLPASLDHRHCQRRIIYHLCALEFQQSPCQFGNSYLDSSLLTFWAQQKKKKNHSSFGRANKHCKDMCYFCVNKIA